MLMSVCVCQCLSVSVTIIQETIGQATIGTVFQGPGFESRWGCMFFTLIVLELEHVGVY